MRLTVALLALAVTAGFFGGCGSANSNEGLVESQQQIDEANARLEGREPGGNIMAEDLQ